MRYRLTVPRRRSGPRCSRQHLTVTGLRP
jgi:hypothetical protein